LIITPSQIKLKSGSGLSEMARKLSMRNGGKGNLAKFESSVSGFGMEGPNFDKDLLGCGPSHQPTICQTPAFIGKKDGILGEA
jgi:hypothetical protein